MFLCCRTNGNLPGGDKGRRRSCFTLHKRKTANGVKPSEHVQYVQKASQSQVFGNND